MHKFSVGGGVLQSLLNRTSTESDDLRSLVERFVAAAEPLEHRMDGEAKRAFDEFKRRSDDIAATLNDALVGICGSIEGQNASFVHGGQEGAEVHRQSQGSVDFSSVDAVARFAPRN